MDRDIVINSDSCIRCGKCVRVCPSIVFSANEDGIVADNIQRCLVCGHCLAVCPTNSISHTDFPAGTMHTIDYSAMPKPEQVLLLCRMRRSTRVFTKQPIPEEYLEQILEAAHRAPTGTNSQTVEFTLVTSPEKLKVISQSTIEVFAEIVKKLENPILKPILKRLMGSAYRYVPNFKRIIKENAKGNDLILRGATAVLLIHTSKENRLGAQDCNLAYQNGSLMAEALGVGQFFSGFVYAAIGNDKSKRLNKRLGIEGNIYAGMALGMPGFRFVRYMDKKPIKVNRL